MCNARNGYTTCFWYNLLNSTILFDRNGRYSVLKEKYSVPYPEKLKTNIIKRNLKLLHGSLPSYDRQIIKASSRGDKVSVNHRIAAFLESYFDILFALNEMPHPGEKRMIEILEKNARILPEGFKDGVNDLLLSIYSSPEDLEKKLSYLIKGIENITH